MKKRLANLVSLVVIQGSNAILPIVIFPFALSVVGSDLYSKIVLAEAISLFLLAVVLYSFEIDGVAQVVGMHPTRDAERVSRVFSSVIYIRLMLMICGAPIALAVAWSIDDQLLLPLLCWLMVPLGYAIQPNWLYQGMEDNAPVARVMVLTRVLTLGVVLTNLDGKQDYLLVPLAIGGMGLLGAFVTLFYAIRRFNLSFVRPAPGELRKMLAHGGDVFVANFCVGLYRDANVLILSALGSSGAAISAYSLAEKIVKVLQAVIRPLNQFYFPQAIGFARKAGSPGRDVFRRLLSITWPQLAILSVVLMTTAVIYWMAGPYLPWFGRLENRDRIAFLVSMMSSATFFGVGNFVFGMAGLSNLGERRYLLWAIVGTGLANLVASTLLVYCYEDVGAALSFVLAEMFLLLFVARRYFPSSGTPRPVG